MSSSNKYLYIIIEKILKERIIQSVCIFYIKRNLITYHYNKIVWIYILFVIFAEFLKFSFETKCKKWIYIIIIKKIIDSNSNL